MTTHFFKTTLPAQFKDSVWAAPLTILLSIAALTISAKIQVPMLPVPITLQTVVVLMLPVLFGYKMALASLGAYFAAGMSGLPVFALGAISGPAYFMGPTGGYLAGFALAILFMGWALTFIRPTFLRLGALMLCAHALILATGTLWLSYGVPNLGLTAAITAGFVPFIVGSVFKSGIAAAFTKYVRNK